jgi:hypothetical protein
MTALLYRYMISRTSGAVVPQPPVQSAGWPTYLNYTGSTLNQNCTGADVNPWGVFATTHQYWQSSIVNSARKSKVTAAFFYPIDNDGNIGPIEMINYTNYGSAAGFAAYGTGVGAHPTAKTFALCQRFGTETFNSFFNSYSATYSQVSGGFWHWNGTAWVGVGNGGPVWTQKPVFNNDGTYVAAALTAATGPTSNIAVSMVGWDGTGNGTVTSSTSVTVPNSRYAYDYWWIGNDLFINGIDNTLGSTIFIYRRSGSSLSLLNKFPYSSIAGYTNVTLGFSTSDPANNRFFSPVTTANDGVSASTLLAGFEMQYDGAGNINPVPITGSVIRAHYGSGTKWAPYPLSQNRLILGAIPVQSGPHELFRTTPSISQQAFTATNWFQGLSSATDIYKAHVPSGAAVTVGGASGGDNVRVQKLS